MLSLAWPLALERYTQLVPQEVLRIDLVAPDGEPDVVLLFRGVSSSLVRATPADPGQPVIAPGSRFLCLDRLAAPHNPANLSPLATALGPAQVKALLKAKGLDPIGLSAD